MSNSCYLTAYRKPINSLRVRLVLDEISLVYFHGELQIEESPHGGFSVTPPRSLCPEHQWGFDIWLKTSRRLESQWPHLDRHVWTWMLTLNMLAFRLGLKKSDEGTDDPPWEVTVDKVTRIDTYKKYFFWRWRVPLVMLDQPKEKRTDRENMAIAEWHSLTCDLDAKWKA